MAEAYRVIAQGAPAAAADTTLYTVPATTNVIISTLTVCNTGATTTFRVAVRRGGAALTTAHYIYFDATLGANVTLAVTIGMTLETGDVLTVRSANGAVAFTAFGTVVTP